MKRYPYILIAHMLILILLISCNNKSDTISNKIDYSKSLEYFELGKNKMRNYDNRGALLDLKKSIEYNPENYEAYMYAAKCNSLLKNFTDAGRYYSGAINLKPNSGEAYYLRGVILINSPGGTDSACYDFSKALEKGYQNAKSAIMKYCN